MSTNNYKKDFFGYIKNLKLISKFFTTTGIAFTKKLLVAIIFAFLGIYLVSPIDVVPDFIPVFGYVEDAVVIFSMLSYAGSIVKKALEPFENIETPKKEKTKDTKGTTIIDVKFKETQENKSTKAEDTDPKDEM